MLDAVILSKEQEERLLNPAPGTAAARALACSVDLRRTIANLRLKPQQRLEQLEAQRALVAQLRAAKRAWAEHNERVEPNNRATQLKPK
jgi:hypothetical protein